MIDVRVNILHSTEARKVRIREKRTTRRSEEVTKYTERERERARYVAFAYLNAVHASYILLLLVVVVLVASTCLSHGPSSASQSPSLTDTTAVVSSLLAATLQTRAFFPAFFSILCISFVHMTTTTETEGA